MDDEFEDLVKKANTNYFKSQKRNKIIQYLKDNILSIIAIIVSIIALFK